MTHTQTRAACDRLRRQDIDATLMWLRHSGMVNAAERRRMALTIQLGSVAAQAVLSGALRCGYCWDQGCALCKRPPRAWGSGAQRYGMASTVRAR